MSRHGAADTKLDFRFNHIFSSKRLRIAVTCAVIVLLLLLSTASLRNDVFTSSVIYADPLSSTISSNSSINWSRFAYTQYATTTAYLCNSVMLFEILHRLGNKADRLLMYPSSFRLQEGEYESTESRLLRKARDKYNVKLKPIKIQQIDGGDSK